MSEDKGRRKKSREEKIAERVEKGQTSWERVRLAAYLGHKDARLACESEYDEPDSVAAWLLGVEQFGQVAVCRVLIALAIAALPEWRQNLPRAKVLHKLPEELIHEARECLINPSEERFDKTVEKLQRAEEEPMLLAEQDGLIRHAAILSLAILAASSTVGDWNKALRESVMHVVDLVYEDKIYQSVRDAIYPWAVGAAIDPLKDRPII